MASFRIENSATEPLPIQIEAFAWSQGEDGDRHVPANDLVIVPRIATIAPGATQLVRVARREPSRGGELAYRVHFIELPRAASPGFVGVRTTVRFVVPMFFRAQNASPALRWDLSLDQSGKAQLTAANGGGRYLRLASLRVVDARGALLAERKGPLYVLAGSTVRWPLTTHARLARGDEVTLEADHEGREESHRLNIR